MISSVLRGTGFGRLNQDRSSRAKTKADKDAGRVNGSAIRPTEDATRHRFAAARTCSGSVDRTQVPARVPDAPISKFALSLDGGNKGLIANSTNLCAVTEQVSVQMTGQNGKTAKQNPVLKTPCKRKNRRKARVHKSRRAHR